MRLRELIKAAVMSAILCVISPITVPFGAVPHSLCTFAVYLAAIILKPAYAVLSVLVYVLLGIFGLPVFSGANGGVGVLAGPTGGFLVGYIICVWLASFLKTKIRTVPSLIFGTVLLYITGLIWFMFVTDSTVIQAGLVCVLPFVLGDALKIAAATIIGNKINKIKKEQVL